MEHSSRTYGKDELKERRDAQSKQIFRRRAGVLAVMAAIAVPGVAAGGARPLAHDVGNFVEHRAEMIEDAFSSNPDITGQISPQAPEQQPPTSST